MKKYIFSIFTVLLMVFCFTGVYAANASISSSKTSATVGDTVTVTVTVNAAAWNVSVSGAANDKIVGFNSDGENQTTTKQYTIDTSKAGTYTVKISGDITDGVTDANTSVSGSTTITVKAKEQNNTSGGNNNGSNSGGNQTYVKSGDATLKALKLDIEGLSPSFSRYTYTYTLSVGNNIDSIRVTASTNHSKAKYSVSGNTNLKNGDNNIYVTVTAENGTTRTYKIIVTKADNPEKANAYLKNIIVGNVKFKTEFSRETMTYELEDIEGDINSLDISVFPENQNATFEIKGNENLKVGLNEIKILVTAEDKKTTKEYTLSVNKLETKKDDSEPDKVEDQNNLATTNGEYISGKIKEDSETQLLILVYILAVVEFFEILYLFFQLRDKNKENDSLDFVEPDVKDDRAEKRRGKNKEMQEENSDIKDNNNEE